MLLLPWQKEEERLRASIRRESQQRRMREKQHQRGLSAGYLEPDRYEEDEEGEESISLSAIKSKYKSGGLRGEEEEEEEGLAHHVPSLATAYSSQENNHNSRWDYLPAYLSKLSVICSPCRTAPCFVWGSRL